MKKLLVVGVVLAVMSVVVEARDKEDGRIIAAYSTKTAFVISSTTTTVFFTCERRNNGDACQRRRFKRYSVMDFGDNERSFGVRSLDPSEEEHLTPSPIHEEEEASHREGRVALTIWTTTSSTFTITATSTDSATTFSLSFFCTIDNNNNNNGKDRVGKFVARFVDTTVTSLATTTTVVPLTCVSFGASPNTCGRRRRYRSYSMVKLDDDKNGTGHTQLDGSVLENGDEESLDILEPTLKAGGGGEDEDMDEEDEDGALAVVGEERKRRREGRIAISIVSTTTTTFTITATSTNDQTTFSISFFCSAPGPPAPPAC
ncbi:hypothetical protein Pmani_039706, partial [Petrolisthes manimaculis]